MSCAPHFPAPESVRASLDASGNPVGIPPTGRFVVRQRVVARSPRRSIDPFSRAAGRHDLLFHSIQVGLRQLSELIPVEAGEVVHTRARQVGDHGILCTTESDVASGYTE